MDPEVNQADISFSSTNNPTNNPESIKMDLKEDSEFQPVNPPGKNMRAVHFDQSADSIQNEKELKQEAFNNYSQNEDKPIGNKAYVDDPLHDVNDEDSEKKSTTFQASISLAKTFLGLGILALPYVFHSTGFLLSSFALIIIAICTIYATIVILSLIDNNKKKVTFSDLFEFSLGRRGVFMYKLFLCLFQGGVCVAYVLFFTDFFIVAFDAKEKALNKFLFVSLSLLFIAPLTLINNFHFFHRINGVSNTLIIITLIAVSIYNCELIDKNYQGKEETLGDFTKIPSFIGVAIFSFESIGTIVTVRNSMREPEKFKNMFLITALVICLFYVLFAVLSCLAFGNRIEHIILLNLQRERNYFIIFQIMYALALVFSYPVQLYPIIQIIEKTRAFQNFISGPKVTFLRRFSFRFFLSVFVFLMAFLIPRFSAFINLIGAFCGIAIQFVFPILSYQIIFRKNIPWSIWILNFFVLFIAVTGAIFASIDSIKELVSASEF